MTPGELRQYAQTMKRFGLTKLKMGDVEISMGSDVLINDKQSYHESKPIPTHPTDPIIPKSPPSSDPIEHKIEQVSSLLKLSDMELVDQLFPDHTEENEESA